MLEIYELLDRFELLYPANSKLSDLRRAHIDKDISSIFRLTDADDDLRKAVIEQNLHSIFRLLPNIASGNIDDLRKAVIEQNLHSIFRLLPNIASGNIDDLRKAVIEQNLHSIFRLTDADDDLRKAVIEQNLHSIFRLTDDDDLRKLTLEDNEWKLWPVLERYVNTQFIAAFKNLHSNNIYYNKDCFSQGQLQSKLWIISELEKLNIELGTVFLCAGWYATLATMLFESKISVDKICSFDIDTSAVSIAEIFNKPWFTDRWKFKAIVENIYNIDYNSHTWQCWSNVNSRMSNPTTDIPDTIINTSCEHLNDFTGWYNKMPVGKLIVLQANDYHEVEEHVNTYNTLDEFSASAPMTTVLYTGELVLPKYTRFMKIGFR